jgi:hypothetical protein
MGRQDGNRHVSAPSALRVVEDNQLAFRVLQR